MAAASGPVAPVLPRALEPGSPSVGDDADWAGLEVAGAECAGVVATGWAVARCVVRASRFTGARLDAPAFTDVRLVGCDVAGADLRGASLVRVELVDCRLSGASLAGASLRDVVVRDCVATEVNLREVDGQRVAFEGCDMTGADLQRAALPGARFERCRLVDVEWAHATLVGADISVCDLDGARGLAGLRGATLDLDAVVGLAPRLAVALGIRVRTDADPGGATSS